MYIYIYKKTILQLESLQYQLQYQRLPENCPLKPVPAAAMTCCASSSNSCSREAVDVSPDMSGRQHLGVSRGKPVGNR